MSICQKTRIAKPHPTQRRAASINIRDASLKIGNFITNVEAPIIDIFFKQLI